MFTLDTNVIIYFFKEDKRVVKFLDENILKGSRFYISSITEAELLGYPEITPNELSKIETVLKTLVIVPVDSQIARLAGFFKRRYKISLPDSIIAATSYLTNTILVTRNIKDFRKIQEISVESV